MGASRGPSLLGVVATAFAGVLGGAMASGALLVWEWGDHTFAVSILGILTMYVVDAFVVVAGGLLALHARYRDVDDIGTGLLWVGLGLTAAGLFSLAPAVGFAVASGYSNDPNIQGAEVLIVATCCLIGITAGAQAWLATRRVRA